LKPGGLMHTNLTPGQAKIVSTDGTSIPLAKYRSPEVSEQSQRARA
jgi:hypothetical protein